MSKTRKATRAKLAAPMSTMSMRSRGTGYMLVSLCQTRPPRKLKLKRQRLLAEVPYVRFDPPSSGRPRSPLRVDDPAVLPDAYRPLGADENGTPHLPAWREDNQLRVWCWPCGEFHFHGGEAGPRVAHCWRPSPFEHRGYTLVEVGPYDPAEHKVIQAELRARLREQRQQAEAKAEAARQAERGRTPDAGVHAAGCTAAFDRLPDAQQRALRLYAQLGLEPMHNGRAVSQLRSDFQALAGFTVSNEAFAGALLAAGYQPTQRSSKDLPQWWDFPARPLQTRSTRNWAIYREGLRQALAALREQDDEVPLSALAPPPKRAQTHGRIWRRV